MIIIIMMVMMVVTFLAEKGSYLHRN